VKIFFFNSSKQYFISHCRQHINGDCLHLRPKAMSPCVLVGVCTTVTVLSYPQWPEQQQPDNRRTFPLSGDDAFSCVMQPVQKNRFYNIQYVSSSFIRTKWHGSHGVS